MRADMPAGFRRAVASGLILPEAESRAREVWTKEDWRFHERAAKFYRSKAIEVFLRCNRPECQREKMERVRTPDGGLILRCEHADRVLTKAF